MGVGKTRLALELAKALNCTGDERPDQVCVHCRQIEHGTHPDVAIIERPEGKDSIAIQQVRELRTTASLRPFQARFRVYVVAGAEALTLQAADALLKTLEEPQVQVVLVLTALDVSGIPETVVSRCRRLALQPVSEAQIAGALREMGQDETRAGRVARLAQGSLGWAVRAAKDARLVTRQEEALDQMARVPELRLDERLALAESLTAGKRERTEVRRVLEALALLARDLLLTHEGLEPRLVRIDQRDMLARQVRSFSLAQIRDHLQRLKGAMERLDSNVDPRLLLEALLVEMP